ncbi:hypothetical protein FBEOM_4509 [Fusarium beomiforme]|uniref:Uncharacterized protein n=1 Tax=Fusarium beomiforme TaxID=44412 RepID=A0A9P5DY32_9HYPO|nr:hypothetical protein FBEOM_4509 [Fusarium beomiforme]
MPDRDPTKPSLEALTAGRHPFSLPWGHGVRVLLGGFKADGISKKTGPWATTSAFDISNTELLAVVPDAKGGSMSYKDSMTTSSETSDDHLSASLGLTVGYPFLNASVTGEYDRNVMESRNVGFTSAGNKYATITNLQGYELGADAGATLSAATDSKNSAERLAITVKVQVLFFEKALPENVTSTKSLQSSSSIKFLGYNTLGNSKRSVEAKDESETELRGLRQISSSFLKEVGALEITARKEMKRHSRSILCPSNTDMAFNYPISSQWITFPTDLKAHALIEWKENSLQSRDALYYYIKCFWGDLKKKSSNDGSDLTQHNAVRLAGRLGKVFTGDDGEINIIGSTKLYVAQEYVENHYANGPLKKFHVRDLAKRKTESPPGSKDAEKQQVYHPPAAAGLSSPAMYQHRFTGLPKSEFLNAVASDALSSVPKEYKFAAKIGSKVVEGTTKLLAAKYGDPLHRFLSDTAVETARKSMDKMKVTSLVRQNEVFGREKELMALQIFELDKIIIQLEESKKTLQMQNTDKEYEVDLRKWIKSNKQELKEFYAAMDQEMGHNKEPVASADLEQPEPVAFPEEKGIVKPVVDPRQKPELFVNQFVSQVDLVVEGDIGAPNATARIKVHQENRKSLKEGSNSPISHQPILSVASPKDKLLSRPTGNREMVSPRQKRTVQNPPQKSTYFNKSTNNIITNNARVPENTGESRREGQFM